MTNAEKFKEDFGFELKNIGRYEDGYYCIDSDADIECKTCPLYEKGCSHVAFINWWNSKYKGTPTKTDLISREEVNNIIETFFEEAQPYSQFWNWKNELKTKVNELQTAEVVPLSVIEDIKAEIEELGIWHEKLLIETIDIKRVLEIIDRKVNEVTDGSKTI